MRVPLPAGAVLVECPDCEATFPARAGAGIWAATEAHNRICRTRNTRTTTRGNTMSTTLKAVEDGKRPHPKQLLDHPDAKIRKAAQKVMDAVAALDAAWEANAEKAELRAKRDRLKKPRVADPKKIRAWAAENGYDVAPSGIIPKAIVADYLNATGGGAA